jgi:mycothiol synthase
LWVVAWDGEEVAGYLTAELPEGVGYGYISSVGVRPRWRGRGLARALLQRSFAAFHARGVRRVTLGVDAENPTGATQLYRSVGMEPASSLIFFVRRVEPG